MKIENYSFGEIWIDGEKYTKDLIVFPDYVKENWWREKGHSVCVEDVEEVLKRSPEIFIVGTGSSGHVEVPKKFKNNLKSRGIKVKAMKTSEAKDLFNKLVEEGKDVVAGLHLTC